MRGVHRRRDAADGDDVGHLNRLNDWGLCFRRCKVCGRVFLASSQRYELCGDKCRKAQALQNKPDFDERARENNYDLLYKNECQNWRNIQHTTKLLKHVRAFPSYHFHVEAWDFYHNNTFLQTQYYIFVG